MTTEVHAHHGYITDKDKYLARLNRIEGQARGIHRMVDEEQYCIDILTQITALTSALQSVALGLLDDHLAPLRRRRRHVGGADGRREAQRGVRRDRPSRPLLTQPRPGSRTAGCDRFGHYLQLNCGF